MTEERKERPLDPEALRMNARNWDAFRAEDPELARIELGIAQCGRILVTDERSSPQYAEALRQDRMLRARRFELWQRRAQ